MKPNIKNLHECFLKLTTHICHSMSLEKFEICTFSHLKAILALVVRQRTTSTASCSTLMLLQPVVIRDVST